MSYNLKKLVPKYIFDIASVLNKNNFETYLVGGSIRDILLNKTPEDFDIATNAYPEQIEKLFPKSIPTGAKFGTITVIAEDENGEKFDVQVTTYRSEADYFSGRWPAKVEYAKTIQEDLSRRDFTINALALNLHELLNKDADEENLTDLIIDPFHGIDDLNKKIIKAVGKPIERFTEDGLRAVRGCRLAAQLQFEIEPETFEAMKQTNHITKLVSVERFREELMKLLLKSPKPSVGLKLMKEAGILELFIPELLEGVGVTQPEFHSDDVFTHSILTVDEAEDSVKLAALFHDIGKPRTMSTTDKGVHFYGHDLVGADMTKEIMKRLKFPNIEIDKTVRLVRWHMFYYPSADWRGTTESDTPENSDDRVKHGWTDGAIRRLIQNVGGEEAIDDLLKLRIADQMSNKKYTFNQEELDSFAERVAQVRAKEMALKITDLDITGENLMNEFNLPAGKKIGDILKYLLDKVIEEPMLNRRDKLIELVREYLNQKTS